MPEEGALRELEQFATSSAPGGPRVHSAAAALDERQDGEEVTRVALLLDEPRGDTWELQFIQELRTVLARKATELGLPPLSLTLVPESEADILEGLASE